jgi:hypothetical protein
LILLLVGRYKVTYIPDCSKTSRYTARDFKFIENLLAYTHASIVVTPHILAELSNHTFDKMLYGQPLQEYFSHVLVAIKTANEQYTHKDTILANQALLRFGFTDLSILEAAKGLDCAVLTDDDKLHSALLEANCRSMNLTSGLSLALA